MNFKKIINFISLQLLYLSFILCNSSFDRKLNSTTSTKQELDFKNLVKKYCGENKRNFCSPKNLKIMFEIEEKRQKNLELARELKRMEQQIIKNILKINERSNRRTRTHLSRTFLNE
jgi:hypothetical protein